MINVDLIKQVSFPAFSLKQCKALVKSLSKKVSFRKNLSINIIIVSDVIIKQFNKQYRKKDKPTDVLSFYYDDGTGEVVISADRARFQAKKYKHSINYEVSYLIIHGILHIIGYDHEKSEKEANIMQKKKSKYYIYVV